jgi:undecaprenyl diphosphate synthase
MNPLNHVAIIMDGNGRWGLKHKDSRNLGHKAGLVTVEKIINETLKKKLNILHYMHFQRKIGKDQNMK